MKKNRSITITLAILVAVIGSLVLLASCENDLTSFLFNNLFYEGWKVSSWSEPVPVVEGESHLNGTDKRNGFPMNMLMGSNGRIHLFGWRVSAREWVHAIREPGKDEFEQTMTLVSSLTENPDGLGIMPGIDLISDDVPYIAYSENQVLCFQEYSAVSGWRPQEPLYNAGTNIPFTFVFFLTADFKTHLFYITDGSEMYHTTRVTTNTIFPDPPELFIDDISLAWAQRIGGNDVAFIYTDSTSQDLYYRTFNDSNVTTIWSVPDSSLAIGGITAAYDSNGILHVICSTFKSGEPLNHQFYSLHYVRNTGGSWEERERITATADSGPLGLIFPASIDIAPDKHGNDRLHMAYTIYFPPGNFFVWYAYYDEAGGWQISPESVDTSYTNSFWTFPLLAVDPEGVVHIVYAWTQTELDRTLMYVRGTPQETQ